MKMTRTISGRVSLLVGLLLGQLTLAAVPSASTASTTVHTANNDGTYTDIGTLTVFVDNDGRCPNGGFISTWGVTTPNGGGNYTPTLTGGQSVLRLDDYVGTYCPDQNASGIAITGFTADPGSSWLVSVTCNGVTKLASDAQSYTFDAPDFQYPNSKVTWQWHSIFGIPEQLGATTSCTIVHY